MESTISIETGLTIASPMEFYADKTTNLMNLLTQKFVGRCSNNAYITGIKSITTVGNCTLGICGDKPAEGSVPIRFIANCLKFPINWTIPVKVLSRDKQTIICSHDVVRAIMTTDDKTQSIKVDQTIMLQITASNYPFGSTTVTVTGVLYGTQPPIYYKVPVVTTYVNPFKQQIDAAYALLKKQPASAVEFFLKLLSNGNGTTKFEDAKEGQVIVRCQREDPVVALGDATVVAEDIGYDDLCYALNFEYLVFLQTINLMISVYNTPDIVKSHGNLWMIYRALNK